MFDIIKDALKVLKSSWLTFYIIPILIAGSVFVYIWKVDEDMNLINGVIDPIGIFAAFMFSLIFIIVEHFLLRKEKYTTDNDEDIRALSGYRVFAKDAVAMTSFSIFLAGWIIILQLLMSQFLDKKVIVDAVLNSVFSFFLVQYAVLIVIITKEMYAMLTEDLESKK